MNIWYQFERIIHSIVLTFPGINFSSSAITPCHVLIRVKSSRMRVKDLQTMAERKNKTKQKFQPGSFLWKARVIKFIIIISFGPPSLWDVSKGSPSMRARHNIDIPTILEGFFLHSTL